MTNLLHELKTRTDVITSEIDGSLSVLGSLDISDPTIETLPVCFSEVAGDLCLADNNNLTNLSGTPSRVGGSYLIMGCTKLTSWEGNSVQYCEYLDFWMSPGITTFTGGPLYVKAQINAKPDMDFYDLPLGDWGSITFSDEGVACDRVFGVEFENLITEFKDVGIDDLPKHMGGSATNPLRRWIVSRVMQGLKPFRNY